MGKKGVRLLAVVLVSFVVVLMALLAWERAGSSDQTGASVDESRSNSAAVDSERLANEPRNGAAQQKATPAALAVPAQGESGAPGNVAINGPELPPVTRRKTLMAAAPAVLSCFAEARIGPEKLDRGMHGRLDVAPAADGTIHVVDVEIVGGSSAPPPFTECVTRTLKTLELDLEPGTRGVVVTPPFAGQL